MVSILAMMNAVITQDRSELVNVLMLLIGWLQLLTATGGMLGAVAALSAESAQSAGMLL